jgi:hypothetical protein
MTKPIESIEFTERDEADLTKLLDGEEPSYHTVLEVWREVLSNGPDLAKEKVTPQWASKMVATYNEVSFADMEELQKRYFEKIGALAAVLAYEIGTDSDCLTHGDAATDALENAAHYKNVLRDWQLMFLQWELDWNTLDKGAGVELAAISEAHKMFFGPVGLTAYLDSINFEFNEADQAELADALYELRDGQAMKDE